jgi:hypothetical protein
MHHPTTWLHACQLAREVDTILQVPSPKAPFTTRPCLGATPTRTQTLKVQKVSPTEMAECCKQGLSYYCDEKYAPTHKCREHKFFHIDASASSSYDDIPSDEVSDHETTHPSDHVEDPVVTPMESVDPVISLHELLGILATHTLKIKGYIKHSLIALLIDSGSTHNFIHCRLTDEIHCFVRLASNFQILIANGGTMKCGGDSENVKLQMGDYHMKNHMFSIAMGGCDIVLGMEWIRTMGPIIMDYQELYMSFTQEAHPYTLMGLQAFSPEIIRAHMIKKLLKKGHHGVITQFNAIQVTEQAS